MMSCYQSYRSGLYQVLYRKIHLGVYSGVQKATKYYLWNFKSNYNYFAQNWVWKYIHTTCFAHQKNKEKTPLQELSKFHAEALPAEI